MMLTISSPRWTGLCWAWAFSALVQLIPPINWYALSLVLIILLYESGIWTGGARSTFLGRPDNGEAPR